MKSDEQAGFFLWETILLSVLLLAMTAAAGLYVRAAEMQAAAAVEGRADYLARAQFSYAQSILDRDGTLPRDMDYLGAGEDLLANDARYEVKGRAVADDEGLWQLQVVVSWTAKDRTGGQEYSRYLGKHR